MRRIKYLPLTGASLFLAASLAVAGCGSSSTGTTHSASSAAAGTSSPASAKAPKAPATAPATTTPTTQQAGGVPNENTKNVACRKILSQYQNGTYPGVLAEVDPQVLGPAISCDVNIDLFGKPPATDFQAGFTSGQDATNRNASFQTDATDQGGPAPHLITGSAQSASAFHFIPQDGGSQYVVYLMWYGSSQVPHIAWVWTPWSASQSVKDAAVKTLNLLVSSQGGSTLYIPFSLYR